MGVEDERTREAVSSSLYGNADSRASHSSRKINSGGRTSNECSNDISQQNAVLN